MIRRAWIGILLAVWPLGRPAAAQQAAPPAPNRASAYLFPTSVQDARAIWVNPAGLGVRREASIYAELAVGDPGSKGRLRQINAGFNSRGLSFAYQRDIFDNGARGSTYRLGLGAGSGGLAVGFAAARYGSSGLVSTGWDLGTSYLAWSSLNVGLVAANIGQPIVRGVRQQFAFVPAFTWQPGKGALSSFAVSADSRITTDAVASYAFGVGWRTGGEGITAPRWPVEIIVRLDTDRGLRRNAFAFGLSIGGQDRGGIIATTPGDVSRLDEVSLYGLSARQPAPGRR